MPDPTQSMISKLAKNGNTGSMTLGFALWLLWEDSVKPKIETIERTAVTIIQIRTDVNALREEFKGVTGQTQKEMQALRERIDRQDQELVRIRQECLGSK